ncbi:hypothetical protein SLNWT_2116 [Streptomyces albus]|uniref:Uncharacterized protein n=1 Tax=Streptomyces albus (strain ATCC 21838 / DSM 41398 / FERM P-419 / JCM 4703 / NBRC 107858) TaxID=1081613 RepID=A0A0B5EWK7_STRA4|nr:hypothetical protein SLNWT_2116 [Streptomyces albus]AOU76807.1 hypothetical protein SLNHY_2116 [Streptomyces albus]
MRVVGGGTEGLVVGGQGRTDPGTGAAAAPYVHRQPGERTEDHGEASQHHQERPHLVHAGEPTSGPRPVARPRKRSTGSQVPPGRGTP